MKKLFTNLTKKSKAIIALTATAIGGSATALAVGLSIKPNNFVVEKGELWNLIKETPENTENVVIISGFVGTTIVAKYLNEVVNEKIKVDVIRGYSASGKKRDKEQELVEKHANLNIYNAPYNSTHMKSYFWFNKNKEIIRTLTGSGNFSESALLKVPSFKEVLYDVTDYQGVGRDLFCGGVDVSKNPQKNGITKNIDDLYAANCQDFDLENRESYQAAEEIIAKEQYKAIVNRSRELEGQAKGLIILTGDGDSEVINQYWEDTKNLNQKLDVFVGNSAGGFNEDIEQTLIDKNTKNLSIIREHAVSGNARDSYLVNNRTPKTHTKIYVWYNQNNEIIDFWSGSANFSKNGVDFNGSESESEEPETTKEPGQEPELKNLNKLKLSFLRQFARKRNKAFREVLIKINLKKNWKNELVCKVINKFKALPSERIRTFCQ